MARLAAASPLRWLSLIEELVQPAEAGIETDMYLRQPVRGDGRVPDILGERGQGGAIPGAGRQMLPAFGSEA